MEGPIMSATCAHKIMSTYDRGKTKVMAVFCIELYVSLYFSCSWKETSHP